MVLKAPIEDGILVNLVMVMKTVERSLLVAIGMINHVHMQICVTSVAVLVSLCLFTYYLVLTNL